MKVNGDIHVHPIKLVKFGITFLICQQCIITFLPADCCRFRLVYNKMAPLNYNNGHFPFLVSCIWSQYLIDGLFGHSLEDISKALGYFVVN